MQINQCKRRCSVENVWQIENSHQCSKEIILTADKCILASYVVDAGFSCQKLYLTAMISTIQYKKPYRFFSSKTSCHGISMSKYVNNYIVIKNEKKIYTFYDIHLNSANPT